MSEYSPLLTGGQFFYRIVSLALQKNHQNYLTNDSFPSPVPQFWRSLKLNRWRVNKGSIYFARSCSLSTENFKLELPTLWKFGTNNFCHQSFENNRITCLKRLGEINYYLFTSGEYLYVYNKTIFHVMKLRNKLLIY